MMGVRCKPLCACVCVRACLCLWPLCLVAFMCVMWVCGLLVVSGFSLVPLQEWRGPVCGDLTQSQPVTRVVSHSANYSSQLNRIAHRL